MDFRFRRLILPSDLAAWDRTLARANRVFLVDSIRVSISWARPLARAPLPAAGAGKRSSFFMREKGAPKTWAVSSAVANRASIRALIMFLL